MTDEAPNELQAYDPVSFALFEVSSLFIPVFIFDYFGSFPDLKGNLECIDFIRQVHTKYIQLCYLEVWSLWCEISILGPLTWSRHCAKLFDT